MSATYLATDPGSVTMVDGLLEDTANTRRDNTPVLEHNGGGDAEPGEEEEEEAEDDWEQRTAERYVFIESTGDVEDFERADELYLDDKKRRIDYVLAWPSGQKDEAKAKEAEDARKVFEENLTKEGLEIEHDIKVGRGVQYTKVHASWEVLSRYAELMHLHMPIKEKLDMQQSLSMWERMRTYTACLMRPFQPDPETLPEVDKKFTHVFERGKEYLFAIPRKKEKFFSHAARSMIVDYILRRKRFNEENTTSVEFGNHGDDNEKETLNDVEAAMCQKTGIKSLLAKGIYSAAYPLHEGSWKSHSRASMRRLLYEQWAHWSNFYKLQPLDHIRVYFGEKVAMYFAWLGYYTYFLVPASIVGLIVFIYGLVTIKNDVVSIESCDWSNNFTMCPKCDRRCPYWNYAAICNDVRASHMFDNGATVFFAVFISLWGTFFLEFWKREQSAIQFRWNLMSFKEEEEPPRPEFLASLARSKFRRIHRVSRVNEPYMPFWRRRLPVYITSVSVMLFLVALAVLVVIGIIVYRMSVLGAMYLQEDERFYKSASLVASATAACINLVLIVILNYTCSFVAVKLTDWECLRTQTEYDSSLTFKLYVLQFVNFYSSLFYIAFFKGRFAGSPGRYNRLLDNRQEECAGGGCLMELCIQLSIIFVGKQIMNSVVEVLMPRVMKMAKICFAKKDNSQRHYTVWEKDYLLVELGPRGMFSEYLEMLLQFGFVTIFVAAFPLAPLCALINNVIEIRIDANKFVTQLRRPMAARTQTIGVWYNVLFGLSRLAVLTNALIIAVTSTFIDRLVYVTGYSEDGTLNGFVNDSLAHFDVSDFPEHHRPYDPDGRFKDIKICRYPDYREPPWSENKYEYTAKFWHILAAQFIFVVVFENVVVLLSSLIAFIIPDMPRKLSEQARQEAYLTNELILRKELEIAQSRQLSQGALRHINYGAPTVTNHGDTAVTVTEDGDTAVTVTGHGDEAPPGVTETTYV
ncbi:hypothetical protein NP493_931g00039 [Ridgeia piscesae]|uniref:Anoctamin n=1 Tax=Ridgeia piscesae TaxID=27915 RepID=A0AAD9KK91_RIDPI|nr:hypothetical protein NP493_931g00039 [Ridgeia piscesae]